MKRLTAMLMLATALASPGLALARDVTITADLISYSGNAAYLAVYLTKPDGTYESTLWLSGRKYKYFGALRGWLKALANVDTINIDGISGASVGGGQSLTVSADLSDALIDAGYQVHVDTAVEHGGEYADDAIAPLSSGNVAVSGSGYIRELRVEM